MLSDTCGATHIAGRTPTSPPRTVMRVPGVTGGNPVGRYWLARSLHPQKSIPTEIHCRDSTIRSSLKTMLRPYYSFSQVWLICKSTTYYIA